MKENVIANKSYAFALRIVGLYTYLTEKKKEFVLSKDASFINNGEFDSIDQDVEEILKIIGSILKTIYKR